MKLSNTIRISTFFLIILLAGSAFAEDLRVFKDKYIVTVSNSGVGTQGVNVAADGLSMMGIAVKKQLNSSTLVVGPESFGIQSVDEVVDFDPNDNFCEDLLQSGLVSHCSPDYEVKISATPNDTNFDSLWGMKAGYGADAQRAWNAQVGSSQTLIAVIDTGVDYNHPDLAANMWKNPGEIPNDGIDNDGNGYIDDYYGWNAAADNGNPMDDNGHGTHCAGTIAGVGNNGRGVAGVNWNAKIVAIKFLKANGSGSLSDAIQAIQYANKLVADGHNLKILNNSWGGGGFVAGLESAIIESANLGTVFVAAAGNDYGNDNDANPHYPSSYEVENVVAVAAIDSSGNLASFSNYGENSVDIAAPGVAIYSTYPGGTYKTLSGTSMATPHVAGALGLMYSHNPSMSAAALQTRLYYSGVELGSLNSIVTKRTLNVGRMIYGEGSTPSRQPGGSTCEYIMEEVAFDPASDANLSEIVVQADEYNFTAIDLPFAMPWFSGTVNKVWISPNGQLYMTSARPTAIDYQAGSTARSNTIAALNTDFYAASDPYGVRYFTSANRAVVYWKAKHYSRRNSSDGDLEVWLELNADGTVKSTVSFNGSLETQSAVQGDAVIGIKGSSSASAFTAAVDSDVSDRMSVKFTPQCSEPAPPPAPPAGGSITSVEVFRSTRRRRSSVLKSRKRATIQTKGSASASGTLRLGDGSRWCSQSASVNLLNGSHTASVRIGKFKWSPGLYAQVTGTDGKPVTSEVARMKLSRAHRAELRSKGRRNSRISDAKFARQCKKLFRSYRNE